MFFFDQIDRTFSSNHIWLDNRFKMGMGMTMFQVKSGFQGNECKKNTVVHISFSSYNVCIRPEAGFCCVQYQVCSDPGSFTIAAGATDAAADPLVFEAAQDTSCTSDYIDIAGKLFLTASSAHAVLNIALLFFLFWLLSL